MSWTKDVDGDLVNLDHVIRIYSAVEEEAYTERYRVYANLRGGGTIDLMHSNNKKDMQIYLDAAWARLSKGE